MPSFIIQGSKSIRIKSENAPATVVLKRAVVNFDVSVAEKIILVDAYGMLLCEWERSVQPSEERHGILRTIYVTNTDELTAALYKSL